MTGRSSGFHGLTDRFDVSRESWERLESYVATLCQWQAQFNLIAPSTLPDIWERHIADSLQLLPLFPVNCKVIADLGTGAGLPGLVLAMARPFTVHLYESNGKKAAFLREAVRQTAVDATVHQLRLEILPSSPGLPKVDVVTARALAPLGKLLDLSIPFLNQGATAFFMKGKDVENEMTEAAKNWNFVYTRHASVTDSQSSILEMREVRRASS
jgi:16S rRNA (guanine527-N7)-methyltransferase